MLLIVTHYPTFTPLTPPHCKKQMIKKDYVGKGKSLSGIGGVETGSDAAEFILLGSDTVQVRNGASVCE